MIMKYFLRVIYFNFKQGLTFQKVSRLVTAVDTQVTVEQGILINVIGQLQVNIISILKIYNYNYYYYYVFLFQTDNDPPHSFTQTFYLRFANGTWFILNEAFRLLVHNM